MNGPRVPFSPAGMMPGAPGTQSGPTQESQIMEIERALQTLAGYGLIAGSTAVGTAGALLSGSGGGATIPLAGAGIGAGMATNLNAASPNIRDVWLDRLRTGGQRAGRERDQ
jgi:hypothetical protein